MKDIKGKVAFITGGASGIGLGIAKAFTKYGGKVLIVDSRQDALDEAMKYFKENNLPAHPIKLNVTDRAAYVKAADEAEKVFGKIHVLVSNAGVGSGAGPIDKLTYNDWDYSLGVNIGGCVNSVMTIVPRIMKHGEGGHVVATSSTCGVAASTNFTIYCAGKFAVFGMMEALAGELQSKNIGVSILIPGPTMSNLGLSSFVNKPENMRNPGETWPPKMPAPPKNAPPPSRERMEAFKIATMDPIETGERVLRSIRNNDLYIHTHPEFKDGYITRHNAIIRAIPDEPRNEQRFEIISKFGTVYYNPVYDTQQQVGPPDW